MNMENTQKLITDFQRLFRTPDIDDDHSIVRTWGFECGDGWCDLIRQLCADIEVVASDAGLDKQSAEWPRVVQVKEKFGTLRFYIRTPEVPDDDEYMKVDQSPAPQGFLALRPVAGIKNIRALIEAAEARSMTICEKCGAPGQLYPSGYWYTACDEHRHDGV